MTLKVLGVLLALQGRTALADPAPDSAADAESPSLPPVQMLGEAFARTAEQVTPSVVYVQVDRGRMASGAVQELVRDFQLPDLSTHAPISQGSGSGFVL
ncbi:MAG: hypothetical protein QGG40_14365, partial [Myxococcota bacterium]|nr:hypothetical protein [Myxococcota bacterium]